MAFGKPHVFGLPDGSHLYGREFELLPAGTMFAASVILHGLVGVHAEMVGEDYAHVCADGPLLLYSIRGTDLAELSLYEPEVMEAFRLKQLQDAQG